MLCYSQFNDLEKDMPSPKHAPKLEKGRQYPSLTRNDNRRLRQGVSIRAINPEHHDDRNVPDPEPPPEPPREWYQSEPIVKTSKIINAGACVLGIFYAALALQQVSENLAFNIFYAFSSSLMSVPLSWFFTIKLIDASIRLKKKEPLYIAAYLVALSLAVGSTAAGLQLAEENANNFEKLPDWLRIISIILFSFNRFCTRFAGSLNVFYAIFKFSIDEYYKRFTKNRIYYQLLYDIKHYRHEIVVSHPLQNTEALNIKVFAQAFYGFMPSLSSNRKPGETSAHFRNKLLMKTATLFAILIFIINMQPLWLKLSVEGIEHLKPIKSLAKNTWAVWYAALSNEFFFLYMGSIFLGSLSSIIKIAGPNIKIKLNNAGTPKKFAILFSTALATITWAVSAYYSGSTYDKDATEAMKNGFGDIANQTWFSWFAGSWTQLFMPVYSQFITRTASGLIVNGTATLNFLMEYVSFFKPDTPEKDYSKIDSDDVVRILKGVIGKHNFSKYENRHGSDIRDDIKRYRDAAEPHSNHVSKLFCCKRRELPPEQIPLNRSHTIQSQT